MSLALEDLLDQTRDAVVAGNLTALAMLAPKVEALADTLPPLDRQTTERLRHKADRNAVLLQAAGRGVRSAQARLVEIANGPTLTTYDAKGRREVIASQSSLIPRRF
ncbi:MAG: hypothetical protein C0524_11205 [Rhodobacter sp.]|nr:hypothetical protein [Rhodobacter sp.]